MRQARALVAIVFCAWEAGTKVQREMEGMVERLLHFQENIQQGVALYCDVIEMGQDITMAVYGGDTPHVGSVVMSIARPSLTGEGVSATSSVLNCVGHKDEYVARRMAEAVAARKNCTVVCTCGIHIDNISSEQLNAVKAGCERILKKILD